LRRHEAAPCPVRAAEIPDRHRRAVEASADALEQIAVKRPRRRAERIFEDVAGFGLHGAAALRRPFAKFLLNRGIEFSDRQAAHAPSRFP
jgi:hypothetical protein